MKKKIIISSLAIVLAFFTGSTQLYAQTQDSVYKKIDEFSKKMFEYAPELGAAYVGLHDSIVLKEGALSIKHKELIALSIAVYSGCEMCIYYHTLGAKMNGASDQEIFEAVAVAFYMGGGPAFAHINYVLKAFEELAKMKAQKETDK